MDYTYLPLSLDNNKLYYILDSLKPLQEKLEIFLQDMDYMNSLNFSKKVMFTQEIKSNNTIEGYYDDISLVTDIIKHPSNILNEEQKRRILNLYRGYKYITSHIKIDKESLKELYSILSYGLLSIHDQENMGEYYRKNPVYIYYSNRIDCSPDTGVSPSLIEKCMNEYFSFLNSLDNTSNRTDIFIKSQILHFYFCYIHPYYDINGRTSRTVSMWYLLNHKAYPFIIFNRAIQLDKSRYYKVIREGKIFYNITYFLKYMLENTHIELEKEYAMQMIANLSHQKLTASDYQALYYILSMKSNMTIFDFVSFYNHLNDHKNPKLVYDNMLKPLFDKGIIVPVGYTKRSFNDMQNMFFTFSKQVLEDDDKIKHLKLVK